MEIHTIHPDFQTNTFCKPDTSITHSDHLGLETFVSIGTDDQVYKSDSVDNFRFGADVQVVQEGGINFLVPFGKAVTRTQEGVFRVVN